MADRIARIVRDIQKYDGPPIRLMEVCGTHTHNISRFGIPALFPPNLELISGPGCPVCVTPVGYIDRAAALAMQPHCTLLTYGDMVRVPGNTTSLQQAKAMGGSVVLMYSPMEALRHAGEHPNRMFYVTAVGFETTLPIYALLIERMIQSNIRNIRLLLSVKALMPALEWICQNNPRIDGFIGPGHVSAILGYGGYESLCQRYGIPMSVTGFAYEPLILAIWDLMQQATHGTSEVHNLYPSAVSRSGNVQALALIARTFERRTSAWRGLGEIAASGYFLAPAYAEFDAGTYDAADDDPVTTGCLCGSVIAGNARPVDCALFGRLCTPDNPKGPCMVSSEGACGIWQANARVK